MSDAIQYSVIIPVYNAEKTLERCLDSLLCQKRPDVEIIAVNDGSTDRSGEILETWRKTHASLLVITQPNSGVSKARNAGIEAAKGTYLSFVDSDDYVSDHYFEALDTADDCDLLVFGSQDIGSDETEASLFAALRQAGSTSERLELLLSSRKIMPPWNKRFKKEIILRKRLRFMETFQIGEDFDFCLRYALQCRSIQISDAVLYYVDISDMGSLSRKYRPGLDQKMSAVFLHIEQSLSETINPDLNQQRLLDLLDYLYIKNVFSCIAEEFKCGKPHYYRNRAQYQSICRSFGHRIGNKASYCNFVHRCLRLMLKHRIVFPIYVVTYLVKWRAFRGYTEG